MRRRTAPFSIRLSGHADMLVREEMRRSGRARSAVVEELAEEAAKTRLFPGIAFRGPAPRRAWVVGTGLDVWEVVEVARDLGDNRPDADRPRLTEAAVNLALAYAERFPEEIETQLAANRRPLAELRELYPFLRIESPET